MSTTKTSIRFLFFFVPCFVRGDEMEIPRFAHVRTMPDLAETKSEKKSKFWGGDGETNTRFVRTAQWSTWRRTNRGAKSNCSSDYVRRYEHIKDILFLYFYLLIREWTD